MKNKFKIIIYTVCVFFLFFIFIFFFRNPLAESGNPEEFIPKLRRSLLKNNITVHLLHSYHSFRKLPDVLFFPYFFKDSQLPEYSLYISSDDMEILNNALPEDPINGYLHTENRVWVDAIFTAKDYSEKVQVKYRGTNANHWNSLQKSLRIKFPNDKLFNGNKTLNLIVPYDRGYLVEPLNFYRAKKLGATTLDLYFSRLKINGNDSGVYLTHENWDDEWFEKRRIPDDSLIFGYDDGSILDESNTNLSPYFMQLEGKKGYWDKYVSFEHEGAFETFADILMNSDDETFRKNIGNILDLKKYYAWNVVNILAGSSHFGYEGNTFLIYNPNTGRFEFSPWDVQMSPISRSEEGLYIDNAFELSQRILRFNEFRQERNKILESYIKDNIQLEDDLAFYDNLFDSVKSDFYNDTAKLFNNFQFRNQVKEFRDIIIDNFDTVKTVLDYDSEYYSRKKEFSKKVDFNFIGSFARFFEAGYTIEEFLSNNPEFYKQGDNGILLGHGNYIFNRDIVIPKGTSFIISPGVTIRMGKGVSIVSYSPVNALGTENEPIKIIAFDQNNPWGTFAVVNSENSTSMLNKVIFDGGVGDIINGITFTGMVAFHNSDAIITKSEFKNAKNDDSLNIKYGTLFLENSKFEGNFSDAIDMDFASDDSVITNNIFINNGYGGGGDAIDLSWSDALIDHNNINGCTDKGVSVGESSRPTITNNIIQNCDIGIAVKDLSDAKLINNVIKNTRLGISVYQKKEVFGGAVVRIKGNTFENIKIEFDKDEKSNIYEFTE